MSCSSAHAAHGRELAGRPHERAVERAVVGVTVGAHAVAGGDHVVEAQPVGERLHEVVRRGGGQHDGPAGGAVLSNTECGERLHHRHQPVGDALGGCEHGGTRATLGEPHGLAGERHRRQGLADGVEQLVEELLTRDRTAHQTRPRAWRRRTPRRWRRAAVCGRGRRTRRLDATARRIARWTRLPRWRSRAGA